MIMLRNINDHNFYKNIIFDIKENKKQISIDEVNKYFKSLFLIFLCL